MEIAIGCDRNGYEYKEKLKEFLIQMGCHIQDVGTDNNRTPVDYPIYGEKVGRLVSIGKCDIGVAICTTGTGIMIAANKVKGIRCGVAYSDEITRLMRQHNNANVIAFSQKFMKYDDVERRLNIFLNCKFDGGHQAHRIEQIAAIERGEKLIQAPIMNPCLL